MLGIITVKSETLIDTTWISIWNISMKGDTESDCHVNIIEFNAVF